MRTFAQIKQLAEDRKGAEVINTLLAEPPKPPLTEMTDDRLLAEFSKRVFQAGFNWSVVENKWPGFEAAFHGFDLGRNAMMSPDDLDRHLKNTDIVRHATKILSIRDNAVFLSDLAREHGSATAYIGNWPTSDIVGLFALLKTRGSRLGGTTAQYALRFAGYDNFILSRSVVAALNAAGVIDGAATSKTALAKVQAAFNDWHAESGERYANISRVLAVSVAD
ncbi:MAG: 3-methyladenine DNA glycosylase [Alphaproteobacteria bacterium]|nr:3-methyladenine DNA glycosylase [Alphaproteobacteria bacterium]